MRRGRPGAGVTMSLASWARETTGTGNNDHHMPNIFQRKVLQIIRFVKFDTENDISNVYTVITLIDHVEYLRLLVL